MSQGGHHQVRVSVGDEWRPARPARPTPAPMRWWRRWRCMRTTGHCWHTAVDYDVGGFHQYCCECGSEPIIVPVRNSCRICSSESAESDTMAS